MPDIAPAHVNSNGFDLDLVRKYNVPGPRYTSYPTAPLFDSTADPKLLLSDIRRQHPRERQSPDRQIRQNKTGALSLYIHLPFCESLCWFCACTKIITNDRSSADRYLDYVEKEIALTLPYIDPNHEIKQLHFGGGTPTFLTPDQLQRLGLILNRAFRFHPECESSVEIDPRRLSRDHVAALWQIGCNRASLGVQDNNSVVQKAVNRIQPFPLTEQAATWLREEGFHSINIDLIYGLPHQTTKTFSQTLDEVLQLTPDRFAIFSYAHVPWVNPAQTIFDKRNALPDQETKLAILEKTVTELTDRGYVYIGMDHFALEKDELAQAQKTGTLQRNFQGYSTNAGLDTLGIGMSSISQTAKTYRQNEKDLTAYCTAIDEGKVPVARGYILTEDDQIRRTTIMHLMCNGKLPFASLSAQLNIDFPEYFSESILNLQPMADDGLVKISDDEIEVTPSGRFLIRNIAMCFDAYLKKRTNRFSKTV